MVLSNRQKVGEKIRFSSYFSTEPRPLSLVEFDNIVNWHQKVYSQHLWPLLTIFRCRIWFPKLTSDSKLSDWYDVKTDSDVFFHKNVKIAQCVWVLYQLVSLFLTDSEGSVPDIEMFAQKEVTVKTVQKKSFTFEPYENTRSKTQISLAASQAFER